MNPIQGNQLILRNRLIAGIALFLAIVAGFFVVQGNTDKVAEDVTSTARGVDRNRERIKDTEQATEVVRERIIETVTELEEVGVLVPGPRGFEGAEGRLGIPGDTGPAGASVRGPRGPAGEDAETIAPEPAVDGVDGEDGPPPSNEVVAQAVADYCSSRNECRGSDGTNGADGADSTVPGPQGPAIASFTFTDSLGITYTCTDPEGDLSYACVPA